MVVLGYLSKLKRSLGIAIDAYFLHDFPMKMFSTHLYSCIILINTLFNTLSMNKVSMSYLFSFSRYQTKYVIKFLFRRLMTSLTLRSIFHHSLKEWPTGRKRAEVGNIKNSNISRTKRAF